MGLPWEYFTSCFIFSNAGVSGMAWRLLRTYNTLEEIPGWIVQDEI